MSVKPATNAVRMSSAGTTTEASGVTRKTPVKSLMCARQKSKFIWQHFHNQTHPLRTRFCVLGQAALTSYGLKVCVHLSKIPV